MIAMGVAESPSSGMGGYIHVDSDLGQILQTAS